MATRLYFRPAVADADYGTGNNDNNRLGNPIYSWSNRALRETAGSSAQVVNTNTVAGPTAGIEVGGSTTPFAYYSLPLDADVTISGSILWNLWANESSMNANVAINGLVQVVDGATGAITLIDQTARTTELGTGSTVQNFSETPGAGVACKRGDRIRVVVYGDDSTANMGSGFTFTFTAGSPTATANGDSYIEFTETFSFVSEPAGSQVFPTNTASDVATASVDREAWTSRGAGVQTDVTNTSAAPASPIQVTDTAGGTVVDWFTKKLQAFTLGGAVRVNLRGLESAAAANAAGRCEIARVDSDGTNAVVWGATTWPGEFDTTEAAYSFLVGGDDLAISDEQRIRIRFYIDNAFTGMGAGQTVTTHYAGTSGGASGDTYVTFTQTLTEFAGVQLTPGLINQSAVLFSPQINQTVHPALINQSAQVHQPSLLPVQPVTLDLIAQAPTLFEPTFASIFAVHPELIVAPGTGLDGAFEGSLFDPDAFLTHTGAGVFEPSIVQYVKPDLIDRSAVLFAPTITVDDSQTVTPELISQLGVLFNPQLNQQVQLGLISQLAALFDPQINQFVALDLISNAATVFDPQINQQVQLTLVQQLATLFAPVITGGAGDQQAVTPDLISQLAVLFNPQINQSVELSLINQSGVLFNPQINQQVQLGLISQLAALFDPQVNQAVHPELISRLATLFNPQINQQVQLILIDQTAVLFDPQINQAVHLGLITQSAVLFDPNIAVTQTVILDLISQLGQIFEFVTGATTVHPDRIDQTAVLFTPRVNQQVQLGLVTQLGQVFDPTLNQSVVLGLINQSGQLFGPTLLTTSTISPDLISQLAQLFDPTLVVSGRVFPDLIDRSGILFSPTFNVQQLVTPGLIASTQQVFDPSIAQLMQLGLIPSQISLFAPTVNMSVDMPLISQTPLVFSPSIIYAGQGVAPDLITQLGQLFDPQINQTVHIPLIDRSGQVFAFAIVFTGSMNWHTQRGMAGTKKGGWPGMQNAMNNPKRGRN